jgi:hypothetical protein
MNKQDNNILARDLVLAAFIVLKRQYESRDAGRAGKLQMFLNIHAGLHGDVKNIVAILNNPKSTAKLSEDQRKIYQRALDIVESLEAGSEAGWVESIVSDLPNTGGIGEVVSKTMIAIDSFDDITVVDCVVTGIKGTVVDDEGNAIGTINTQAEPVKAKPGRKANNPIEMAAANAQNKVKECC